MSYSLKQDVKFNLNQIASGSLPIFAEGQFKAVMAGEMHLVPV